MIRIPPLIALAGLALAGCASGAGRDDLPVCDGRHRRPVNAAPPAPADTPPPLPVSGGCA